MTSLELPIRAATETAVAHGIIPDRCDVLQNGSTLVLRLTETLVARVVQDVAGPRQGTAWFERENAIALHLTRHNAPVIPLHPQMPPFPYVHLGYPMNFWKFVTVMSGVPSPEETGRTLYACHEVMRSFPEPLPSLAILSESLEILEARELFPAKTQAMLCAHLREALRVLADFPHQALHGDAHLGNLLNTTDGLLWTDWEDTFSGPLEWDLASAVWNAQILEEDHLGVRLLLDGYRNAGGKINETALHYSLVARGAVMTAWYPILYPNPNAERQSRLSRRIEWLESLSVRGDLQAG